MTKHENNKNSKKWLAKVYLAVFICGAAAMMYPVIANFYNNMLQNKIISGYKNGEAERSEDKAELFAYEREKALAYNDTLWPTPDPEDFQFLKEEDPLPEYMDCLNLNGDGIMGYVDVPKISESLPIYHTTEGEGMNKGAGHLEGTSLPIGGASTHSVIAAHRGLPGHALFTDLDKMEIGDEFFLHILGETLAYEVDQTVEVEPTDTSQLVITEGQDYCTLLTCTPYGVNTERLLVRGHRVPYSEGDEDKQGHATTDRMRWLILVLVIIAALITWMRVSRHRRKKKLSVLEINNP